MPKFNVNVSFSLRTTIEPEGTHFDRDVPDKVTDLEDQSYFRTNEIDADGGAISFECEAESEEDAERISEEIVYDGMEVEDDSGFTWVVDDRVVEVEKVEIPMDLDRAKSLVVSFLDGFEALDEEYEEAFGFILDLVVSQEARIVELRSSISTLRAEIDRLRPVEEIVPA
jgi:hypothetical protein